MKYLNSDFIKILILQKNITAEQWARKFEKIQAKKMENILKNVVTLIHFIT